MARSSKTADGFVLADGVLSSGEPQYFAGFPGLWQDGVPVAAADIGVEDFDSAWDTIRELGLPLEKAYDVPRAETPDDIVAEPEAAAETPDDIVAADPFEAVV